MHGGCEGFANVVRSLAAVVASTLLVGCWALVLGGCDGFEGLGGCADWAVFEVSRFLGVADACAP